MSTPIDLQTYRACRDAFAAYDPHVIPDDTAFVSDNAAERAFETARVEYSRVVNAVHDLHATYLDDACELTDADCAALKSAHRAWVAAAAAFEVARAACPVSEAVEQHALEAPGLFGSAWQ